MINLKTFKEQDLWIKYFDILYGHIDTKISWQERKNKVLSIAEECDLILELFQKRVESVTT